MFYVRQFDCALLIAYISDEYRCDKIATNLLLLVKVVEVCSIELPASGIGADQSNFLKSLIIYNQATYALSSVRKR